MHVHLLLSRPLQATILPKSGIKAKKLPGFALFSPYSGDGCEPMRQPRPAYAGSVNNGLILAEKNRRNFSNK